MSSFPHIDMSKPEPSLTMSSICSFLTVLEKDNDDNAELAIKSINEMQKFYRNTFFVLVSPVPF